MNQKKLLAILVFALSTINANASDKVSSPNITKDQLTFELRSGYDWDEVPSKDNHQVDKFVAAYGITDRLRPEVKAIYDNPSNDNGKIVSYESELRYQIFKPEEAFLSTAIEANFKWQTQKDVADRVEVKLLIARPFGNFNSVANLSVEQQFGEYSKAGQDYRFGWSNTYKANDYFSPGVEIYGDTGIKQDNLSYNEQKYYMGPVIYGKLTNQIKYDVGYLFGISDAAPDSRLKAIISYNVQF